MLDDLYGLAGLLLALLEASEVASSLAVAPGLE
jgi:hypothetical protein